MFRNAVSRERYLRARSEILHSITRRLPLLFPDGDDEGYFHLVRLTYLVSHAFSREIHRDGHVFAPQILREPHGVSHGFCLNDTEHKLGRRSVLLHKIVGFEKVARGHISHGKSDGGNRVDTEERKQIIVAAAAK